MTEHDDTTLAHLSDAGVSSVALEAALEIDTILAAWRRRFMRRELGQQALAALGVTDIDMAQLDALFAVTSPPEEGEEIMVSTIAHRLVIDPSRASRLASDLIRTGYARRAVSQQDARRTVIEPTEAGAALARAVRDYKFLRLGRFLSGWTPEQIATFIDLLGRFSEWSTAEADAEPPAVARIRDELHGHTAFVARTAPMANKPPGS